MVPDVATAAGMTLERANAAFASVDRASQLAAPLVAGLLIAAVGAANVLWIDAATFIASAAVIAFAVPSRWQPIDAADKPGYFRDLADGFRFLRAHPLLRSLLAIAAMYVGSFIAAPLPLIVLSLMPGLIISLLALGVLGLLFGPGNPIFFTVFQERVPERMRGRIFGLVGACVWLILPIGMLVAGALVEWFGMRITLLIDAAVLFIVSMPDAEPVDDDGDAREPSPA